LQYDAVLDSKAAMNVLVLEWYVLFLCPLSPFKAVKNASILNFESGFWWKFGFRNLVASLGGSSVIIGKNEKNFLTKLILCSRCN